ncbi:hypothetical protein ZWY2020_057211 [Hordeum vulgare]|nr:hypothetical protein ZWY2020_057211 [Hordeum vulgare]
MQRRIAEELKLDRSAMDLFDKQDEEDDFSGVDKSSRAEIPDVGRLIFNRTMGRTLLVIFQNGSDDEIDFGNFGIPIFDCCRAEDVDLIDDIDKKHVIEWEFLKSLWVLDIRDTNWDWILSPSKMVLMTELRELNLKAVGASSCVWDMTKLELTWLCNLQILRVIDSPTFFTTLVQDPFMGMQNLELLDLSGNSDMEVLPNISVARRMKVLILDGCAGLKQVESAALPKSLESFSFDGFGRASKWKNSLHMRENQVRPSVQANKVHTKVYKISLEGCEHLKNVFLRGLPNLKELNLSDTAIQALDLEAMQVLQLESSLY